jgi:hypothetical protein
MNYDAGAGSASVDDDVDDGLFPFNTEDLHGFDSAGAATEEHDWFDAAGIAPATGAAAVLVPPLHEFMASGGVGAGMTSLSPLMLHTPLPFASPARKRSSPVTAADTDAVHQFGTGTFLLYDSAGKRLRGDVLPASSCILTPLPPVQFATLQAPRAIGGTVLDPWELDVALCAKDLDELAQRLEVLRKGLEDEDGCETLMRVKHLVEPRKKTVKHGLTLPEFVMAELNSLVPYAVSAFIADNIKLEQVKFNGQPCEKYCTRAKQLKKVGMLAVDCSSEFRDAVAANLRRNDGEPPLPLPSRFAVLMLRKSTNGIKYVKEDNVLRLSKAQCGCPMRLQLTVAGGEPTMTETTMVVMSKNSLKC